VFAVVCDWPLMPQVGEYRVVFTQPSISCHDSRFVRGAKASACVTPVFVQLRAVAGCDDHTADLLGVPGPDLCSRLHVAAPTGEAVSIPVLDPVFPLLSPRGVCACLVSLSRRSKRTTPVSGRASECSIRFAARSCWPGWFELIGVRLQQTYSGAAFFWEFVVLLRKSLLVVVDVALLLEPAWRVQSLSVLAPRAFVS
jgi:hypothetical protein